MVQTCDNSNLKRALWPATPSYNFAYACHQEQSGTGIGDTLQKFGLPERPRLPFAVRMKKAQYVTLTALRRDGGTKPTLQINIIARLGEDIHGSICSAS